MANLQHNQAHIQEEMLAKLLMETEILIGVDDHALTLTSRCTHGGELILNDSTLLEKFRLRTEEIVVELDWEIWKLELETRIEFQKEMECELIN